MLKAEDWIVAIPESQITREQERAGLGEALDIPETAAIISHVIALLTNRPIVDLNPTNQQPVGFKWTTVVIIILIDRCDDAFICSRFILLLTQSIFL